MKYFLAEVISEVPKDYDWDDVRCFKPSSSLSVVRGRLMQLLSRSVGKNRSVIIYKGSCPETRISIINGRISSETIVGDQREKEEVELDFHHESRRKIKNQRLGRTVGNIDDWIKSSKLIEGKCDHLDPHLYVPMKKIARGTMFGERK